MSETIVLKAAKRTSIGGKKPRHMVQQGQIPAVIYGADVNQAITLDEIESRSVIGHHGVITVDVEGTTYSAIVKEVQRDRMKLNVTHIDFQAVDATHEVTSTIPVEAVGTPKGAVSGGQLEQPTHELEVKCLPAALPEVLTVDVSGMDIDAILTVADITLPQGVAVTNPADTAVFAVHAPKVAAATEDAEEASAE